MSAIPIVPGLMYQVRHNGQTRIIFARNPVDAIVIVLEQLGAV